MAALARALTALRLVDGVDGRGTPVANPSFPIAIPLLRLFLSPPAPPRTRRLRACLCSHVPFAPTALPLSRSHSDPSFFCARLLPLRRCSHRLFSSHTLPPPAWRVCTRIQRPVPTPSLSVRGSCCHLDGVPSSLDRFRSSWSDARALTPPLHVGWPRGFPFLLGRVSGLGSADKVPIPLAFVLEQRRMPTRRRHMLDRRAPTAVNAPHPPQVSVECAKPRRK
eukprot:3240432-Rhodomonas_salina.1